MLPSYRLNALAAAPSRTRFRITLWIVSVSVVIQGLLGCAVFLSQRYVLDQIYNARLTNLTRLVDVELRSIDSSLDSLFLQQVAKRMAGLSGRTIVITFYNPDGSADTSTQREPSSLGSLGFSPQKAIAGSEIRRFRLMQAPDLGDSFDARGLLHTIRLDDIRPSLLLIATDDLEFDQLMSIATSGLLLAIAAGVAGTTVAAWFISGLALSPLAELSSMLRSLAPETIRDDVRLQATNNELATFQRDLAETRERLRLAFQAQDRLIANASHELKTPIAVLMVEAETIDLKSLPANAAEFVRSVRDEMRRLGQTTENFVMLSRLRGGRTLAHTQMCPVNEFVMDAVAKIAPLAARRQVALRPELAAESSRVLAVVGDVDLLRTMVEHLLSNAVRASPESKEVAIVVESLNSRCSISVNDEGDTLPDAAVATLFDRYIEPEATCNGRRDLGLAIAQGIAELHGGHISARSNAEGGCRYTVDLAVVDESSSPDSGDNAPTKSLS